MTWTPWHFLVVAISGWLGREQQVTECLPEENRILRENLSRVRTIRRRSSVMGLLVLETCLRLAHGSR